MCSDPRYTAGASRADDISARSSRFTMVSDVRLGLLVKASFEYLVLIAWLHIAVFCINVILQRNMGTITLV